MAISARCAKCGNWRPVFPKGSNLPAFLFCAECFPTMQVKVTRTGGVTIVRNKQEKQVMSG